MAGYGMREMADRKPDGSIEWLREELRHLDGTLRNGQVTNFHHETEIKVKIDAYGPYRSRKKKFYIQIEFDS